jgi:predicted ABC-type ATPase
MKNMYIISGCNGAGKTTAAFYMLPEMLECKEFVNLDEIAKGLSPFNPESATYPAVRLLHARLVTLLGKDANFAVETTLSALSYIEKVHLAHQNNFKVNLLFFWLNSTDLAKERVKHRVSQGGHNVPEDVIVRRYERGLFNFFNHYIQICDNVMFFDNSGEKPRLIMGKVKDNDFDIYDEELYNQLKNKYTLIDQHVS